MKIWLVIGISVAMLVVVFAERLFPTQSEEPVNEAPETHQVILILEDGGEYNHTRVSVVSSTEDSVQVYGILQRFLSFPLYFADAAVHNTLPATDMGVYPLPRLDPGDGYIYVSTNFPIEPEVYQELHSAAPGTLVILEYEKLPQEQIERQGIAWRVENARINRTVTVAPKVATGHDADGREFAVWESGEELFVGLVDGEPRTIVEFRSNVTSTEIILADCNEDGADDLTFVVTSPDGYSAWTHLTGMLLPDSDSATRSSFAISVGEPGDDIPDAATFCSYTTGTWTESED